MTEPEQAPRNAGELFTQCQRRFSLTPEEVPGLLGFADTEELKAKVAAYSPAFDNIERGLTLRSGRVLRPQGNLDEALAEAEQKAWEALDAFRLGAFGHWAEVWASLAKTSGKVLKNPFGGLNALGRTQRSKRGGS